MLNFFSWPGLPGCSWKTYGSFLKWWYPTTIDFPTKNDHFGVFWGYHHFWKHPYVGSKMRNLTSISDVLLHPFKWPQEGDGDHSRLAVGRWPRSIQSLVLVEPERVGALSTWMAWDRVGDCRFIFAVYIYINIHTVYLIYIYNI